MLFNICYWRLYKQGGFCYVARILLHNKKICYIAHPNLPDGLGRGWVAGRRYGADCERDPDYGWHCGCRRDVTPRHEPAMAARAGGAEPPAGPGVPRTSSQASRQGPGYGNWPSSKAPPPPWAAPSTSTAMVTPGVAPAARLPGCGALIMRCGPLYCRGQLRAGRSSPAVCAWRMGAAGAHTARVPRHPSGLLVAASAATRRRPSSACSPAGRLRPGTQLLSGSAATGTPARPAPSPPPSCSVVHK